MATKSDFSSVEWKKVLNSVGWVYRALTEAEHSGLLVRRQESGDFNKYIKEYKGSSALVKEIIADQKNADDKLSGDADACIKAVDEIGNLVESKAGAGELNALRAFLVGSAEALAKAVKEDRGKGADNISDIEQGIINRISAALTPAATSAPAQQAPSATRGGFTVGPAPVQTPAPAAPPAPKPAMPGIPAVPPMPAAPSPDVLKAQADAAAAKLKAEADAKAKQLADAKAAADAQAAKLKAEADAAAAKLKAEADAKAKQLADAKAAAEAQAAKVQAEAEAKAKELADIKAKAEAEAKAKVEAEAAKMRAELEQAKAEAEKAKAEAEAEKARLEAEAKARAEALAKAQAAEVAQREEAIKAKLAQEQAEAAAKVRTHTVKANETLSHISLHYYGTASRWQEIFEANRDTIKDARLIYPGQVLRIP